MDRWQQQVRDMLKEVGATSREGKHTVWTLPNNRVFVTPRSPSDHRASRNSFHELRNRLNEAPSQVLSAATVPEAVQPERRRVVIPNWPEARRANEVRIPEGAPSEKKSPPAKTQRVEVGLSKVLTQLEKMESYWKLSPCGRINLVRKMVEQRQSVDVIAVRAMLVGMAFYEQVKLERGLGNEDGPYYKMFVEGMRVSIATGKSLPVIFARQDDCYVVFDASSMELLAQQRRFTVVETTREELTTGAIWVSKGTKTHSLVYFYRGERDNDFERDDYWYNPRLLRPIIGELTAAIAAQQAVAS